MSGGGVIADLDHATEPSVEAEKTKVAYERVTWFVFRWSKADIVARQLMHDFVVTMAMLIVPLRLWIRDGMVSFAGHEILYIAPLLWLGGAFVGSAVAVLCVVIAATNGDENEHKKLLRALRFVWGMLSSAVAACALSLAIEIGRAHV